MLIKESDDVAWVEEQFEKQVVSVLGNVGHTIWREIYRIISQSGLTKGIERLSIIYPEVREKAAALKKAMSKFFHESADEATLKQLARRKNKPKGLWYNIHMKRRRGEAPRKPGEPGAPKQSDFDRINAAAKSKLNQLESILEDIEIIESDIDTTPPKGVQAAAKRGLELRRKWGRGGTAVGVARARDLSNGKSLSRRTLARMSAFARHLYKYNPSEKESDGGPTAKHIAILLWGGQQGIEWAARKLAQIDKKKDECELFERDLSSDYKSALLKRAEDLVGMDDDNSELHSIVKEISELPEITRLLYIKYSAMLNRIKHEMELFSKDADADTGDEVELSTQGIDPADIDDEVV